MNFYFIWHYTSGLKSFFEIWGNFIGFFWNYFSIKLLFKTLFNHWHKDISQRKRGFSFEDFFWTLGINLLSRIIGAILRLFVISFGLFFIFLVFLFGLIFLLVWLFLPIAILASIIWSLFLFKNGNIFGGVSLLVLSGFFAVLSVKFHFIATKKSPFDLSLEELFASSLFNRILLRSGIAPEERKKINPHTFLLGIKPREGDLKYPFIPAAKPRDIWKGVGINSENLKSVLENYDLTEEDFKEVLSWVFREEAKKNEEKKFWTKENLARHRGIGKDWAYGYTVNLDRFSKDLGKSGAGKLKTELIGRASDIETIERILVRAEENNLLIVGEPGTGRKTVVQGFADLIYQGKVLPPLKHKRVLEVDIEGAMASSPDSGGFESRLQILLNEAVRAGNIILVINDFHDFIGAQTGLGKIDISSFLTPYLSSKNIQIIGIATYKGFHEKIESNPNILKYFEKVEIKEPDEESALMILEDMALRLEKRAGVSVTYPALKEILKASSRYFTGMPMPERAIDLLDEALIYAATKTGDKILKIDHIDKIISEKAKIPVGEVQKSEKEKLINLEDILHKRVIDQEEAIRAIASAMRRARMGVRETKKPIGTFLFLGPTGVGKTETAKALGEAYFGSEERMVRFDMSEYQNPFDLARLIGSAEGEPGVLTTQVRENPFSLVLLDELEKAHPNILNLFLQILDEGFFTDGWGRKVIFRNAIIIATSNAGAEFIREMIEKNFPPEADQPLAENSSSERDALLDYLQENSMFKPEFLNRFDEVIIFKPLSKENLVKIANLLLNSLAKRLAEQKITLIINQSLCEKIAELGYSPEYGARPMKRVIQDRIEDLISRKLLDNSLKKGDKIEIKAEDIL